MVEAAIEISGNSEPGRRIASVRKAHLRALWIRDAGRRSQDPFDEWFAREGCEAIKRDGLSDLPAHLDETHPDIVWLPIDDSAHSAVDLVARVHEVDPLASVLLYGDARVDDAIEAIRAGAVHVVVPPVDEKRVRAAVRRLIERLRVRGRAFEAPRITAAGARVPWLVGDSEPMRQLSERVALVAPTRSTVLLLGETGTGKERVADAIHALSTRSKQPFVRVHCAALAETLLESELFGHERGAFTGAHSRREGRFRLADGGTILLDEIGEISPALQVKLLRVLQERSFERVGGAETLTVDVRLIAATHRDLKAMVAAGTFRADLYYRLNVVALEVPPLRARRDDIPPLVEHHLARLSTELGLPFPRVSAEAMRLLRRYDWPGNVRELENVLERALVLSRRATLEASDLEPHFTPELRNNATPRIPGSTFADIERHAILTTYEACGRSPLRTAEMLGLSLRTVHYRLREYAGGAGRRRPKSGGADAPRENSRGEAS